MLCIESNVCICIHCSRLYKIFAVASAMYVDDDGDDDDQSHASRWCLCLSVSRICYVVFS